MDLNKFPMAIFLWSILSVAHISDSSDVSVKFLKAPLPLSNSNSAIFVFQVLVDNFRRIDSNSNLTCKLDYSVPFDCASGKVSFTALGDGNHTFEACCNGSRGVGCARYNWTIDTIPPTAYLTASTYFTDALNISVYISFSEPCMGPGGFGCSALNSSNLLVYGGGQVISSSFKTLQPSLRYSLLVNLSSVAQYGKVIMAMDKSFCTDSAGNEFIRTEKSIIYVRFDRRSVTVILKPHIPEWLLKLNNETRTVQATNDYKKLLFFVYFSEAVINSSMEIMNSLNTSQGSLVSTGEGTRGKRKFGFLVTNISGFSILTINLDSSSIISKRGTPASPVAPVTFLYDSQRPAVRLSTIANMRTRDHSIPVSINFLKSVFGFNASDISISGGHLQSFHELSRMAYTIEIYTEDEILAVYVPENVTSDVAGNKNLASNILRVNHYSLPTISLVVSMFATASFLLTSVVAGLLTISTSSLQSIGAFSRPTFSLTSHPARNLFRIACHIQVFAMTRWLPVTLPVEYYEFSKGLQWSIPYFNLPWETGYTRPRIFISSSATTLHSSISIAHGLENFESEKSERNMPLTPKEYRLFFESENPKPEAEYIKDPQDSSGWRDFKRNMFWLAVTGGGMVLLHVLLLLILKFRKEVSVKQRGYGALTFPRFEIFLVFLALPCICKPSATLLKGGESLGIIVGALILGIVSFLMTAFLLFLSFGISFGKILQYKEVHQEGQNFYWYQDIVRMTLGPGKIGQWTWKNQPNSENLIKYGPLFEDLRGPPKYILIEIAGATPRKHTGSIISTDDETEDAAAPFIQKLFGILRIYYTFLELVKRVSIGIIAGAYLQIWSSRTPILTALCITSFQLLFLVLKKPFIKKKVQLIEIISVSCEVGIFATCLVILEKGFSSKDETRVGIIMVILFLVGYIAQLINEWYALYSQTKRLDPTEKSFISGLELALIGIVMIFIPQKFIQNLKSRFPVNQHKDGANGDTGSSAERYRSSSTADRQWMKHTKKLVDIDVSICKEGNEIQNDASSSGARWSDIWGKKSGSSSLNSSSDSKSRLSKLYKDMEAIFASNK